MVNKINNNKKKKKIYGKWIHEHECLSKSHSNITMFMFVYYTIVRLRASFIMLCTVNQKYIIIIIIYWPRKLNCI